MTDIKIHLCTPEIPICAIVAEMYAFRPEQVSILHWDLVVNNNGISIQMHLS